LLTWADVVGHVAAGTKPAVGEAVTSRPRAALVTGSILLSLLVAAPSLSQTPAPAIDGCAENPDHPGGDWRHYGGGLDNARNQHQEEVIGTANVADLELAWSYAPLADGVGDFQSTPIVHGGCVFLTGGMGHVVVRNADTGDLVWRTSQALPGNAAQLIGRVITGSPAVSDDFWIYVGVLRTSSPYVAAFRPSEPGTWELAWQTTVDETPNAMIVAGPQLYEVASAEPGEPPRVLLYQGFMGSEGTATPRGGFAILDPYTGELLARDYTIDQQSYADGYRGASIWGYSAIDPETSYIYAPTGNPASKTKEHQHANAIVKIDGDPARETFGQIVGSYKGTPDNYVELVDLYDNPVCQTLGEQLSVIWGQLCLQLDLDFGAAPNLLEAPDGTRIIGALQKSGIYHWIDAETMGEVGRSIVGAPNIPVNSASPAFDDERVYVNAQPPGQLWGLDRDTGQPAWVQPMADVLSYLAVSTANGVVYHMDAYGDFRMTDAATGIPIAVKPLSQEFGQPTLAAGENSSGIAIARNTVYVTIPEHILAYRLPGR
jgi:polyvinyl alcohol dehydrogenase (cytochrome)